MGANVSGTALNLRCNATCHDDNGLVTPKSHRLLCGSTASVSLCKINLFSSPTPHSFNSILKYLLLALVTILSAACGTADDSNIPAAGTPAILITPLTGLITSEAGHHTFFVIVLNSKPTAEVTIPIHTSNADEGMLLIDSINFTPENWAVPQSVSILGVDDAVVDGDVEYMIITDPAVSDDAGYNGIDASDITLVNLDNDEPSGTPLPSQPGVILDPTTGLITTEDGGSTEVMVMLNTMPGGDVTIQVTSSDTGEGIITPATMTFTSANWDSSQPLTITGVDDGVLDGDVMYHINITTTSSDPDYNNLIITPLSVTNHDNDVAPPPPAPTAGISISPTTGHITSESGTMTSFTVVLDSQPSNRVTIDLSSSDSTEGTVNPARLIFTTTNWNMPQTVNVTGVDDIEVDGNIIYTIELSVASNDANYAGLPVDPVSITNLDNDVATSPGITVVPTTGLITDESGASTTISLVLDSEPAADVMVAVTSSNINEGSVSPANLVFTPANWDSVQSITVTGVDDDLIDGDISYTISFSVTSLDTDYDAMSLPIIDAINLDNDTLTPGIIISPTSGLQTSENQDSAEFSVTLAAPPSANVNISMASSNTNEGTLAPVSISFSASDWDSPQTITITGVDDAVLDGDITYHIEFSVTSDDSNYNAISVPSLAVVNLDNETPVPPTTPDYTLYIEPGTLNITPSEISGNGSATLRIWGYSLDATAGKTPGPVLEAVVGQTLLIEVINDHLYAHSFVIEGLLTGTPELAPGESMQFEVTPTEAGVYRYGDGDEVGLALGMMGALVVRPADGSSTAWSGGPAYDQERTWVITDMDSRWNNTPPEGVAADYNPNYFLLNGQNGFAAKNNPETILEGNVDEQILVRIVNAGQYDESLHFHAAHFRVISQGGVKVTSLEEAPQVTTVNVKRGSTAMILYPISKTGSFPIHVHSAHMETGNGVYLNGVMSMIIGH